MTSNLDYYRVGAVPNLRSMQDRLRPLKHLLVIHMAQNPAAQTSYSRSQKYTWGSSGWLLGL